ncbi:transcriptional regulator with XRE-family HTH domain [Amycolatopsis bartoniae]|uniref:HTH cro/C1-type domain-containing protein n=1 Tax=Amycolatopsis bartoniae TaxID=941986 RepID=A0A8H9IR48_9PSEU|nr:helix-turn-helix transcriptional regulator [Amycolatopsis bartoniae]MBB2936708.1 transcriptional regulator with XRE-family HTH domain [Amycolatopsis bartoniae]TVS99309.1 helix-turn-helix domain-containing protein [Amycolatopsis bartoniae]GHF49625.1 hypothetical protein GCM10017566_23220 [Amycolatopsis bartoniae]
MTRERSVVPAREQLGEQLRRLRTRSGKSLKQLEKTVHASDSSLSRYLSGATVPPWPVVEQLCREADEDTAALRPLWEQAAGEAPEPTPDAPERKPWRARHPAWFLAAVVAATAVVFAAAGLVAGAELFPRVVVAPAATQDKVCADWPWPDGPGQEVEAPARPNAVDHQPVVALEQAMVGGVWMVFAHLTGAAYGDRVWLDVTADDGATWNQCGPFLVTGPSAVTRAHALDPRLEFRACADVVHYRPGTTRNVCTEFW